MDIRKCIGTIGLRVGIRRVLPLIASILSTTALAEDRPSTVLIEEMTWTEVRDDIHVGKTTVIIPIGGTEQSGPHMALGKHNVRVKTLAGKIAASLGNALVAPVVAYVPEGSIAPPSGHMRFAGTISVPDDAFKSMLASEKLHSLVPSEKLPSLTSQGEDLIVRIFSFSFHQGFPKDETGNGGGFVFDGRSLPNPGREERFKSLTGKDAPVIEFLNQQETAHQFLASVLSLVDASVGEYQRRGFKNLMISFGCTGGQHRSVYLAEQLAKRLRNRNGLEVVVRHLELDKLGKRKTLQ